MTSIEKAEAAWRAAAANDKRLGSAQTSQAEQEAWDAYTDRCNEIDQCQEPGCRKAVPEYAYCSQHRPK